MIEANENADKCVRSIPRTNSDVVCELAYERRALWKNLQFSHEDIVTRYIDKEADDV